MAKKLSSLVSVAIALAVVHTASVGDAADWGGLYQPSSISATFVDTVSAEEDVALIAECSSAAATCSSCRGDRSCCGCWTPTVGVEATFLWPSINGTATFTQAIDAGAGSTVDYLAGDPDDLSVAPRIWIGAKRNCWGVAARFWKLEQYGSLVDPTISLADPERFSLSSSLEAYTLDVEATRDICFRGHESVVTFGARYAWLDAGQISDSTTIGGGSVLSSASAMSSRQFGGTGLTGSWQGSRPLQRCCNVSAFWNARGSILWGDGTAAATTSAIAADAGGGAGSFAEDWAIAGNGGDMFIGEIQIGLQYERQLKCVPGKAFLRGAFEYQYWDTNADVLAAATSTAGVGNFGASALAVAGDTQLDLYGFSLATGMTW